MCVCVCVCKYIYRDTHNGDADQADMQLDMLDLVGEEEHPSN